MVRICLMSTALAFLAGCRGAEAPATVQGRVFFRQMPLSRGLIVFCPDETRGSSGPLARAEIQADGTYNLATAEGREVQPGWYRVTVAAIDDSSSYAAGRSLLPIKYRDPDLSGLSREVMPGRENHIDFDLQ
jgi:hypothetical protein